MDQNAVGRPPEGAPAVGRLTYWPSLDGLRGLAVVAVLLFHSGLSWARGGFLGVSLFFTLSGFLITSLVVHEREGTGQVALRSFWARRARRLLPASILALGLALVVTVAFVPLGQRLDFIGDIRAALVNLANWRFIWRDAPYAGLDLVPSPVQHYWSLAIEEQFYVVFPVLAGVALRWRTRGLAVVLGVVAVASCARQLSLHGVERIYFGTDTRAAELAIGGLLAMVRAQIIDRTNLRRGLLGDVAGGVALLATLVLWWGVDQQAAGLYRGGLTVVAVVSAVLIFGSVEGRVLPRVLGVRPLVELGKISYGVYLFHFPLFLALSAERTGLAAAPLLAVRVAATLAISLVSYHLLERPIRTGRAVSTRLAPLAVGGAFAVVAVLSVALVHRTDSQVLAAGGLHQVGSTTAVSVVPPVPVTTASPPPSEPPQVAPPASIAVDEGGAPAASPLGPAPPPRIVVVGDSTAGTNGAGLQRWGASTGRLEVATVSGSGCATLTGERFRVREGYEFVPHGCDQLFATAAATAKSIHADAIVVFIGSSQLADWRYADLDGWHHLGEAVIDSRYVVALDQALGTLATAGVPILWADTPTPAWDLDVFGQQLGGGDLPGQGPVALNDPERAAALNATDRQRIPTNPLATVWPYTAELAGPGGAISTDVRPDGLHVSPEAMAAIADRSLFDTMGRAYRSVLDRSAAGAAPRDQAWSR